MAQGRRTARSASGRPIGARRRSEEAVEIVHADTGETAQVVDASSRFSQLREAVSGMRTKAASGDIERYLLIAGGILMPLGLVLIFFGWQGASNTPYTFEQTPYLISGGLLGLGFMVAGGFLYFGYWLTRMVQEQRASADRLAEALERMEAVFTGDEPAAPRDRSGNGNGSMRSVGGGRSRSGGAAVRSAGSARGSSARSSARSSGGSARGSVGGSTGGFVATPGGSMFHRQDCVVVDGKTGLRRVSGEEKGLAPCGICDPLAA